jgi:hypothetical protein
MGELVLNAIGLRSPAEIVVGGKGDAVGLHVSKRSRGRMIKCPQTTGQ